MISAMDIQNISFKYSNNTILKNISFSVDKGDFLGILGPNGCGKTTLLKNLCNLLKPYDGKIFLGKEEIGKISCKSLAKRMAVVHQFDVISFDFTVHDIVLMGRMPYQKRYSSEIKRDYDVVEECMKKTETWKFRDKKILQISGGERQRVMLARALAQEPEILLLDEPISHLDIKHQINLLNLCKKLNLENNLTIIVTIHDINLAAKYCDNIILMQDGKIQAYDKPERVLTEKNIKKIYDIGVELIKNKEQNMTYIIPKIN
ncbi:heme ABC transporter ATP-binding protein [Abyssisolibacter fermentans]|uniref:heme ABC transporter ATP-binding protein n=1 Tax=Abyssisolibacter fermentans TaxID=1766203 RepID=UPI0009EACB3E|nr:heme ABC transporter ATP-binding protein [Abyssisolibacter fermentans]